MEIIYFHFLLNIGSNPQRRDNEAHALTTSPPQLPHFVLSL